MPFPFLSIFIPLPRYAFICPRIVDYLCQNLVIINIFNKIICVLYTKTFCNQFLYCIL